MILMYLVLKLIGRIISLLDLHLQSVRMVDQILTISHLGIVEDVMLQMQVKLLPTMVMMDIQRLVN